MYFVKSNINIYPLARAFLNDLFNEFNLESDHLVFDQLILPYHREKFDQLFPGFKQIVVDRDPRDVFLDAKDYNAYPITQDINSFISFYKSSRSLKSIDADEFNLFIQFEDLIYKYDQTTKQIQDFLEIDSQKHAKKFSRLDPSKSINNTQTWLKPENNKYKDEISSTSLAGIKYKRLQIRIEITIPKKRGTFIEHRNGMINICPVGRSCTQEERDEFFEYDNEHKVREYMVNKLKQSCKNLNLSFSIGGQISIDIFPKGWDKTYALQFVKNYDRILFFGDKTEPGGNDYEIFKSPLTESYHVDNPEMTIGYINAKFFDDV